MALTMLGSGFWHPLALYAAAVLWLVTVGMFGWASATFLLSEAERMVVADGLRERGWRTLVPHRESTDWLWPATPLYIPQAHIGDAVYVPAWGLVALEVYVGLVNERVDCILLRAARSQGLVDALMASESVPTLREQWRLVAWSRRTAAAVTALDLGGSPALLAAYRAEFPTRLSAPKGRGTGDEAERRNLGA